MVKRIASLALTIALVFTIAGTSVLANTPTNGVAHVETLPEAATSAKSEGQPREKLRAAVTKLLADTKAGKRALPAQPQIQPARSNGLSKGKKIALGVGIAVVVVAVIVIIHEARSLGNFDFHGISIH
ncbi:MAG: hypothetical protein JWM21_4304 [Acidobacteria bacterium]|nr:hypothetical protein [Acidobacteriota bacterium]